MRLGDLAAMAARWGLILGLAENSSEVIERLYPGVREVLAEAPGIGLHRRNLVSTLRALGAGTHPLPDAADGLLRHHTDWPTGLVTGRHLVVEEAVGSRSA